MPSMNHGGNLRPIGDLQRRRQEQERLDGMQMSPPVNFLAIPGIGQFRENASENQDNGSDPAGY